MLQKMNFRQQLTALLVVVVAAMSVLVGLSLWGMQRLEANVETLYLSGAKPIRALGELASESLISIKGNDRPGFVEEVKTALTKFGIAIKSVNLSKDLKNNAIQIEGMAKLSQRQDLDALVGTISRIEGVADFQIHQ